MKQCSPSIILLLQVTYGFVAVFLTITLGAWGLQSQSQVSSNLERFIYCETEREFLNHSSNILPF